MYSADVSKVDMILESVRICHERSIPRMEYVKSNMGTLWLATFMSNIKYSMYVNMEGCMFGCILRNMPRARRYIVWRRRKTSVS